ncbi:hypothetical protein [uncultured Sphingomonas sp.]|nr:hypothetical protein [uncultured Sphingomonas sp.]
MTEPRSHPALTEEQRDPDSGGDPDELPAGEPEDNPDDLTVGGEE